MLTILSLKRACMSDKQLLTFSDHSERCGRGVGMQQVTAQFHVYSQPLAPPLSLHVARGRCKSSQALNPAGQRQMRHKFPSTPQRRLRPASRMQYVEQPSVLRLVVLVRKHLATHETDFLRHRKPGTEFPFAVKRQTVGKCLSENYIFCLMFFFLFRLRKF